MTDSDVLLTTEEVAAWARVSIQTIIRLVEAGKLEAFRVGRPYRYRIEAVQAAWPTADATVEKIQAAHARVLSEQAEQSVDRLVAK